VFDVAMAFTQLSLFPVNLQQPPCCATPFSTQALCHAAYLMLSRLFATPANEDVNYAWDAFRNTSLTYQTL
jgi:hypothetical protein